MAFLLTEEAGLAWAGPSGSRCHRAVWLGFRHIAFQAQGAPA